jgi:hypothetical protein
MGTCGLDLCVSGHGTAAVFCERGNELSGLLKWLEDVDLRDENGTNVLASNLKGLRRSRIRWSDVLKLSMRVSTCLS